MELKLGAAIKKLRTEKGVTQETLADYIGVSFQAVSKWETDTTMPDITLLPKLVVFFGVRIDDLFSINTDDELERIDNMLANESLTDDNFTYARRTLDSILQSNQNDVAAIKRYAMLYISQSNKNYLTAGRMLQKAMEISPLDEELYMLYRTARGGDPYFSLSGNDWFIDVCEPYARRYPQNKKLRATLVEAMIGQRYYDRAEEYITEMRVSGETGLADIFTGDIEMARGNITKATEIWQSIDKCDHKGQYEAGERFRRLGEYDAAILCFENSFAAAKVPRDLSAVYSLAFIYTKLGENQKAIDKWQLIIEVIASDYGVTVGEQVHWPLREIEILKNGIVK